MKDMTLRRPVNSKPPNASKLNPQTSPVRRTSFLPSVQRERSPRSNSSRSSRYRKGSRPAVRLRTPNVKSTANYGHFHSGQVPDERATESLKWRRNWLDFSASKSRFFEDVLNSSRAQPNCANDKEDGSAYGSYLRNYADREKRQRQKFVEFADSALRMVQLCEARPVFLIAFLAAFLCLARRNFFARPKDML